MDRNRKISDIMYLLLNASDQHLLTVEELLKNAIVNEEQSGKVISSVNEKIASVDMPKKEVLATADSNTIMDNENREELLNNVIVNKEQGENIISSVNERIDSLDTSKKEVVETIDSNAEISAKNKEKLESEVVYKPINWRGYIPKADTLDDFYFNSMGEGPGPIEPHVISPGKSGDLIQKIDGGIYRVLSVPKNLDRICFNGWHRSGLKGFMELDLSKDEFYKLSSLKEENIKLEDGKDIFDAIKQTGLYDNRMKKAMIPFVNNHQKLKPEDIRFIDILLEIGIIAEENFLGEAIITYINILNDDKSLNFEEMKYLAMLCDNASASNYVIDNRNVTRDKRNFLGYFQSNVPWIYSVPLTQIQYNTLSTYVIELDINEGICSSKNIEVLSTYLKKIFEANKRRMLGHPFRDWQSYMKYLNGTLSLSANGEQLPVEKYAERYKEYAIDKYKNLINRFRGTTYNNILLYQEYFARTIQELNDLKFIVSGEQLIGIDDINPYYHEYTRNFDENGNIILPPAPDSSEIWYGMNSGDLNLSNKK